jgi:hypothetical protein
MNTPAWGVDRLDQRALPLDGRIVQAAIGTGVTAYIIDTGIRTDHTEFAGRVGSGYSSIADGNGANDCNGHGTHVSGTVAGTTLGVAPGAQVRTPAQRPQNLPPPGAAGAACWRALLPAGFRSEWAGAGPPSIRGVFPPAWRENKKPPCSLRRGLFTLGSRRSFRARSATRDWGRWKP